MEITINNQHYPTSIHHAWRCRPTIRRHCPRCWKMRLHYRRVCGRMETLVCAVCGCEQHYCLKEQ